MACWNERGCDPEMWERCPHNLGKDYCPVECKFAQCDRPQRETVYGMAILDNPDVDRSQAVKEVCRSCKFFITHGPKVGEDGVHEQYGYAANHGKDTFLHNIAKTDAQIGAEAFLELNRSFKAQKEAQKQAEGGQAGDGAGRGDAEAQQAAPVQAAPAGKAEGEAPVASTSETE
jgi:hypothetical protein